ncbi:MAG: acyloxyacyl hydrolase [Candidatus Hydrogenedentes bacterium]|nr:acyloxyacyl hydrolase [Candidatus Hydrogenedentota bacterium]
MLLANAAPAEEKEKEQKLIRWRDGLWRTELSIFTGIRSGGRSRTNDVNLNGTLEYEMPAGKRGTAGIRIHPLFFYDEKRTDRKVWGGAVGPMIRIYRKGHDRRGLFGEMGGSVLWHSNEIRGNTSRVNFLFETGVGYKFDTKWHVSAKVRHFSNAGIDSKNSGVNAIGLAVGYTF